MANFGYPFDIELTNVEASAVTGSRTLHYRIIPDRHCSLWQGENYQYPLEFMAHVSQLDSTENLDLIPKGADLNQLMGNHFIGRLQNIQALHQQIANHRQEVIRLSSLLAQRVRSLALDSEMPVEQSVILGGTAFELEHQDYWSDYTDTKYWAEDALAITKVVNLTDAEEHAIYPQSSETPVSTGVPKDENTYTIEL